MLRKDVVGDEPLHDLGLLEVVDGADDLHVPYLRVMGALEVIEGKERRVALELHEEGVEDLLLALPLLFEGLGGEAPDLAVDGKEVAV